MHGLRMKWAALGAVGVLGLGAESAFAQLSAPLDLSILATRSVLLQTEDTICDNGTAGALDDYGADTFSNRFCTGWFVTAPRGSLPAGGAACCAQAGSNAFCTGAGTSVGGASACCSGPGTGTCTEAVAGTCDADNALPPNFTGVPAGCTTFASPAANFTDTTGAAGGSADLYATLTSTGPGTWTLTVPPSVWRNNIQTTLTKLGATLIENSSALIMDFNTLTEVVSAPTASPAPSPPGTFQYWRATGLFAGVPITLVGEANTSDYPFFGSSWLFTDPADPLTDGVFQSQCFGPAAPSAYCDGFLTDVAAPVSPGPTLTGVPLTLSCAAAVAFPVPNAAVFGPGMPLAGPANIDETICNPPGLSVPIGDTSAGTNFIPSPGVTQVGLETYLTAFTILRMFAPTFGANATTPAFATQDFWVRETPDTDADLVPDWFDNCLTIANPVQCDGDRDGYGNTCDADINNNGSQTGGDIAPFIAMLGTGNLIADMNCNGSATGGDIAPFIARLGASAVPGPSGLACAGTIPCP